MSHQLSDFQEFRKDATSAVIAGTDETRETRPINDKVTRIQSTRRVQLDSLPATLEYPMWHVYQRTW